MTNETQKSPSSARRTYKATVDLPTDRHTAWGWLHEVEQAILERVHTWPKYRYTVKAGDERGQVTALSIRELHDACPQPRWVWFGASDLEEREITAKLYEGAEISTFCSLSIRGPDEVEVQGLAAIFQRLAERPAIEELPPAPPAAAAPHPQPAPRTASPAPLATPSAPTKGRWRDHPWIITIVGSLVVGLLLLLAQQLWLAA